MTIPHNVSERLKDLARRFLQRTASELDELKELITVIPTTDSDTFKRIEVIAHRMRGSGAMFGFELISDATLEIEMLAAEVQRGLHADRAALQARLEAQARLLSHVLREYIQQAERAT